MARRKHISSCSIACKVVQRLIELGWRLYRGARHQRVESPDGRMTITVPGTPSDHRATRNWISQIRRQGVPVCVLEGL